MGPCKALDHVYKALRESLKRAAEYMGRGGGETEGSQQALNAGGQRPWEGHPGFWETVAAGGVE